MLDFTCRLRGKYSESNEESDSQDTEGQQGGDSVLELL